MLSSIRVLWPEGVKHSGTNRRTTVQHGRNSMRHSEVTNGCECYDVACWVAIGGNTIVSRLRRRPSRISIDITEYEMGSSRGNKRYKKCLKPQPETREADPIAKYHDIKMYGGVEIKLCVKEILIFQYFDILTPIMKSAPPLIPYGRQTITSRLRSH